MTVVGKENINQFLSENNEEKNKNRRYKLIINFNFWDSYDDELNIIKNLRKCFTFHTNSERQEKVVPPILVFDFFNIGNRGFIFKKNI